MTTTTTDPRIDPAVEAVVDEVLARLRDYSAVISIDEPKSDLEDDQLELSLLLSKTPSPSIEPLFTSRIAEMTLLQKIAAITGEIHVDMTGKYAIEKEGRQVYSAPAISIGDVEDALASMLSKYRIVTNVAHLDKPTLEGRLYTVHVKITLYNADGIDELEAEAWDVGNTPSGAVSFAIKRYYKALFHIGSQDEDSEDGSDSQRREAVEEIATAARQPRPAASQSATPVVAGLAKGFPRERYDDLLSIATNLPTDGENPFVQRPEWAEKKLLARLKHFSEGGDFGAAYKAMRAELLAYLPEPAAPVSEPSSERSSSDA